MKYRLIGWVVFLMLLFITQKAIAGEGFYTGGKISYIPVQESAESTGGPESGTGLGLILGYQLTPIWAFQITLSRVFLHRKGVLRAGKGDRLIFLKSLAVKLKND